MNFEDVFNSKIRMKVLKLLFTYGQMNPSNIASRLKVNYRLALTNLELLEKETILEKRSCGRKRFFRFANTNKAQATLQILEEWERE